MCECARRVPTRVRRRSDSLGVRREREAALHSLADSVIVGKAERAFVYGIWPLAKTGRLGRFAIGSTNFHCKHHPLRPPALLEISRLSFVPITFSLVVFQSRFPYPRTPVSVIFLLLPSFLRLSSSSSSSSSSPFSPSNFVLPAPLFLLFFFFNTFTFGKKKSRHSRHFCLPRLDRGLNFAGKFLHLAVFCGERARSRNE